MRGEISTSIFVLCGCFFEELNIIDEHFSWEIHPSTNAEFAPPRCCQTSAVGVGIHVLLRDIVRASDERVRVITATSTRFHRTVIDRGGRCGSRATKSTPPGSDVASRVTLSTSAALISGRDRSVVKKFNASQSPDFS